MIVDFGEAQHMKNRLREIRRGKGLSQADLANAIGMEVIPPKNGCVEN